MLWPDTISRGSYSDVSLFLNTGVNTGDVEATAGGSLAGWVRPEGNLRMGSSHRPAWTSSRGSARETLTVKSSLSAIQASLIPLRPVDMFPCNIPTGLIQLRGNSPCTPSPTPTPGPLQVRRAAIRRRRGGRPLTRPGLGGCENSLQESFLSKDTRDELLPLELSQQVRLLDPSARWSLACGERWKCGKQQGDRLSRFLAVGRSPVGQKASKGGGGHVSPG